ncbi:MAG: hypothetical protein R3B13_27365 [Polyangiaceae bacterium]
MSQRKTLKTPFVVTVTSVVTLAATSCGGSTSGGLNGSGGSGNQGAVGGSGNASSGGSGNASGASGSGGAGTGCPVSFPNSGPCGPEGAVCSYPQGECCPPWEARCVGGQWEGLISSCNPPPPDPCPVNPPKNGETCGSADPCGSPPFQVCTYDQCNSGQPNVTAQCMQGVWSVKKEPCAVLPCEQLTPCQCFDRIDCQALSEGCLCECDYNCPGKPPCDCACGGGKYLGCTTKGTLN